MTNIVSCVCSYVIVISISSVTRAQAQPLPWPCPQSQYSNPSTDPVTYQPRPCISGQQQTNTVQNTPANLNNFEESLNQILMNQVLTNPSLKNILDPNTKFFNKKGVEIQRQPNTASSPNVINNYFIVPPEFFKLNDTDNAENGRKIKKTNKLNGSGRIKQNKNTKKVTERVIIENDGIKSDLDEKDNNNLKKTSGSKHKKKKRNQSKSRRPESQNTELSEQKLPSIGPKRQNRNKKTKQIKSNDNLLTESLSSVIDDIDLKKKENALGTERDYSINKKTKNVLSNKTNTKEAASSPDDFDNLKSDKYLNSITDKSQPPKTKKRKQKNVEDVSVNLESKSLLQDIESLVDNKESNNDLTENRKIRNPKTDKMKVDHMPQMYPVPEDMLKMFSPYMHLDNYFTPYCTPFDFQTYFPLPSTRKSSKRNKKRRNRIKQNENPVDGLPNVVEVRLTPKKQETTLCPILTEKTLEESGTTIEPINVEITTLPPQQISDSSVEVLPEKLTSNDSDPDREQVKIEKESMQSKEHKPLLKETEILAQNIDNIHNLARKEPMLSKENLKMPINVGIIEDLHEYITPELGAEDLIPTMYSNGIIQDYYPIFTDDYANEESYILEGLEDDRLFYSTDKGSEEEIFRDRRKYDDIFRMPNMNIKDRINFRHGLISNMEKNRMSKLINEADAIQKSHTEEYSKENILPIHKKANNDEVKFQTPPGLENPDFVTKKIEKSTTRSHIYSKEDSRETYNEKSSIYSDAKTPHFSSRIKPNTEIMRVRVPSKNTRPKSENVETVYAKSRVVTYGVPVDESDEYGDVSVASDDYDDKVFNSDEQTSYVVATSLRPVDVRW